MLRDERDLSWQPQWRHGGSRPHAAPARSRWVGVGAVVGGLWGAALATQYMAARLAYHPHLGPWVYQTSASWRPWLKIAGIAAVIVAVASLPSPRWRWSAVPLALVAVSTAVGSHARLYSPLRIFAWQGAYHGISAYHRSFVVAWSIWAVVVVAVTTATVRLLPAHGRSLPEASGRDGGTNRGPLSGWSGARAIAGRR